MDGEEPDSADDRAQAYRDPYCRLTPRGTRKCHCAYLAKICCRDHHTWNWVYSPGAEVLDITASSTVRRAGEETEVPADRSSDRRSVDCRGVRGQR
jgi:hypothetical protein